MYIYIYFNILMHVPCIILFFLFQPTNAQIYITTLSLYIMFTPPCFDISVSSSGSFKTLCLAKLHKFLKLWLLKLQFPITQRRPNNILIYFNLIILWNCNINSHNFKNLRNLARHKFLKLPEGDTEMSKHVGSEHYIKR